LASAEDTGLPLSRTRAVARSFGRRARDYTRHAHLQQHAARTLADFLREHVGLPATHPNSQGDVVEIGCGTGLLTELLHTPGQPYLATDLSPEMLEQCRARLSDRSGSREGLSLAVLDGQTAAFAVPPAAIVSNLTCQWFADPVSGIARLARQTPLMAFSVPLHGSFPEWEAAFADLGRTSGLLPLPDEQAVLAALEALGPARLLHSVEERPQHFPSATAFADSFRLIGADQPRAGYAPAPIRPVLKRFSNGLYATARILYCLVMREMP
jgi:malonyl-CoA O-methyltransferase